MQNLTIEAQRLWDTILETAQIGGTPKGGICRLTLTDVDAQVRDWFKTQCEALGCAVTVDAVGNMFALRPGKRNDIDPIGIGSHLDTQPTGGKFDGVLGVLGGLEVLRTLNGSSYETNAPLLLINWTNEEGSRFPPAMLGSGVHAGVFDQEYADSRLDRQGIRFADAIEAIGYRGNTQVGATKLGALFELHIEQGPILEAEGKKIGVVTGVQGMRWYEVNLTGQEAHTGSTPMNLRRNALLGAARVIEHVNNIAHEHPPGVGTVGLLELTPNSRNVIPGRVFFTIDFRHPEDSALVHMEENLLPAIERIAAELGLQADVTKVWDSPAVHFDKGCIAAVRAGAAKFGLETRDIISGAGHDAAYIARVAPSTMIFVPCAGGLSHNEAESTTLEECAVGTQVLLNSVLEYDLQLATSSRP
jgi:N-carbamoyl-L-amino-acid hydrolase